jgi:excisionase family DNA binding protein
MSTHQLENEKPVRLTVSKEDEVAIQQRADRVGKQLGEAVASLISEIMVAFLSGKIQTVPTGPNPLQAAPSDQNPLQVAQTGSNLILTAGEVAKFLRISKAKVYRMMQLGEIPSVRFGRTSRVRHQDLDDFIQKHSG